MKTTNLLPIAALAVVACVHVPRVAPIARNDAQQAQGTVQVEVTCGGLLGDGSKAGTGVIVSQRHVLTAAHVVKCPYIPRVYVTVDNGDGPRRLRMYVTREDSTADIARLEIASAERFGLGLRPPVLDMPDPGHAVCAMLALDGRPTATCGTVASMWTVAKNMHTSSGDSGAPVFSGDGKLVGLVVNSGVSTLGRPYTRISPVDDSWIADLVPVPASTSPWRTKRPPMTASN